MDPFFSGIDSSLVDMIKEAVTGSALSKLAQEHENAGSVDTRLGKVGDYLSQQAVEQETATGVINEEKKKTLSALSLVYLALEDWTGAASVLRTMVSIDDQVSKDDHPDRDLAAMFNFGIALNKSQQYREAEEVFTRLLPMLEAVPKLGKSSQQYAGSLGALMLAVGKQGRVEDARKLYAEHTAIVEQYDEPERKAHADSAAKVLEEVEREQSGR